MEITIDTKDNYRTINILQGRHGFVENQAKDLCIMRTWHDKADLYYDDDVRLFAEVPALTPEIEAEIAEIQAEFEKLYQRMERLMVEAPGPACRIVETPPLQAA